MFSWSCSGFDAQLMEENCSHSSCSPDICPFKIALLYKINRKRIYTEKQAKVVAAVWGTEFIQLYSALAIFSILHRDE